MADVRAYWAAVAKAESELPPGETLWMISLESRDPVSVAGSVAQVPRNIAAELVVKRVYRLAKPEELAAYEAQAKITREENQRIDYERKQHFALPPELAKIIDLAVAKSAETVTRKETK